LRGMMEIRVKNGLRVLRSRHDRPRCGLRRSHKHTKLANDAAAYPFCPSKAQYIVSALIEQRGAACGLELYVRGVEKAADQGDAVDARFDQRSCIVGRNAANGDYGRAGVFGRLVLRGQAPPQA